MGLDVNISILRLIALQVSIRSIQDRKYFILYLYFKPFLCFKVHVIKKCTVVGNIRIRNIIIIWEIRKSGRLSLRCSVPCTTSFFFKHRRICLKFLNVFKNALSQCFKCSFCTAHHISWCWNCAIIKLREVKTPFQASIGSFLQGRSIPVFWHAHDKVINCGNQHESTSFNITQYVSPFAWCCTNILKSHQIYSQV